MPVKSCLKRGIQIISAMLRRGNADPFVRSRKPFRDTKMMHTVGRRYTEERHRLHRKIVRRMAEKAEGHHKGAPIAILIGGGTASGKTTLRKGLVQRELKKRRIKAALIDPDELKAHTPEYKGFQKTDPKRAASLVHRESCDIGALLLKRLLSERKSFIYEGTMARTDQYIRLVERLRGAGYRIEVFVADVPLRIAKRRAVERARRTGRAVPARVIEITHRLVPGTLEAIKDRVDCYWVYDMEKSPKLIASKEYVDGERYDRFLKKGQRGRRKRKAKIARKADVADDVLNPPGP